MSAPAQPQGQELPASLGRWRHAVPAVLLGTRCRHSPGACTQGDSALPSSFPRQAGSSNINMAAQAASVGSPPSQGSLQGHEDAYGGLILNPDSLPESPGEFSAALAASLDAWRQHGYRGIWLKVPRQRAHLVGHAVDAGFEFHHAEKVLSGTGQRGVGCSAELLARMLSMLALAVIKPGTYMLARAMLALARLSGLQWPP